MQCLAGDMTVLTNDDVQAVVLPELGGALAALRCRGVDLLRPAPPGCVDVRQTACFPMVPFANRIADACFDHGGPIQLTADPRALPHALHGTGWRSAWTVVDQGSDWIELRLHHDDAGGWPWRFEARQRYSLLPNGIAITLAVINHDEREMPAGLGLHPYFSRSPPSRLRTRVAGGWRPDARGIATQACSEATPSQLANGVLLDALAGSDLCFFDWIGEARIAQEDVEIVVRSEPNPGFLHLFAPANDPCFCLEPVTHAPDAVNRCDVPAMLSLAPGEMHAISMSIEGAIGSRTVPCSSQSS